MLGDTRGTLGKNIRKMVGFCEILDKPMETRASTGTYQFTWYSLRMKSMNWPTWTRVYVLSHKILQYSVFFIRICGQNTKGKHSNTDNHGFELGNHNSVWWQADYPPRTANSQ
jgi:hypothetical protein